MFSEHYIKRMFPLGFLKGVPTMSAIDKLVTYVSNLTPEQVEKLFNYLPKLTSLLEEPSPPSLREQTSQTQ